MLQIRPATNRDWPFIQQWAVHSALEAMCPEDRARANPTLVGQQALALIQTIAGGQAPGLALVADHGGHLVGYILAGINADGTTGEVQGHIMDLFVLPQLRRKRIGSALQMALLQQLKAMGLRKVKTVVDAANQAATGLASAHGFKPEGLIGLKEW